MRHGGGGSFVISLLIILNVATELVYHTNAGRVAGSDPRSWPDKIMNLYNSILLKKKNKFEYNARRVGKEMNIQSYFPCYTVHVVELFNYYTNYCTYIKFIKFKH